MIFPDAFPISIQTFLRNVYGEPVAVALLAGKSGAAVFRCTFTFATVILKATVMRWEGEFSAEAAFYQRAAPHVRAARVPIPDCYRIIDEAPEVWLVLENMPELLPRSRWTAPDDERLEALARLHTIPLTAIPRWKPIYQPGWSAEMTDQALSHFGPAARSELAPQLETVRLACQPTFIPESWISADPNPRNWGIRESGDLALFDWERFTSASPAIDVAIQIGGMGDRSLFRQHADADCRVRERLGIPYPISADQLSHAVMLAKVWSVIEYLSSFVRSGAPPDSVVDQLRGSSNGSLSEWLKSLHLSEV
ncbi:MAG: phosphotransferase [Anaerolineae bacterium]